MELKIKRKAFEKEYTIGDLYIDGKFFSSTIEDCDRGLTQDMPLEEIKATFAADRFATEVVGVEIQSAEPGHAVCALKLRPELMNAAGIPQGGAIFTLAAFTFAVSANAYSDRISVSMQHDITYFAPARGKTLLAESRCVRCGRSTCFYVVEITDDLGGKVAHMTVNGFVTAKKMEDR